MRTIIRLILVTIITLIINHFIIVSTAEVMNYSPLANLIVGSLGFVLAVSISFLLYYFLIDRTP
ncbi:hypothetical protein HSE3_gp139 [Bacillus phage vB_BceM-HSE3]|nr:hypothetical protein HSE3_gp139 [Bacillus phage vB_BceM-HSE3]